MEVVKFRDNYYLYFATRTPDFKIQLLGVARAPGSTNFNRETWNHLSIGGSILKPELPWEKNCIEAPSVLEKNGRLYMFYAGAYNNEPQQVGVAVSSDGIRWERLSDEPFLSNGKPGEWNSSESFHIFVGKMETWLSSRATTTRVKHALPFKNWGEMETGGPVVSPW